MDLQLVQSTVVLLLVFLPVVICLLNHQRKLNGQIKQTLKLQEEMTALLSCERGMGERIKQQQRFIRNMEDRQDKLEIEDAGTTSYKQAMALLRKGVSADELVDACDMSRGELELLSRIKTLSNTSHNRL